MLSNPKHDDLENAKHQSTIYVQINKPVELVLRVLVVLTTGQLYVWKKVEAVLPRYPNVDPIKFQIT